MNRLIVTMTVDGKTISTQLNECHCGVRSLAKCCDPILDTPWRKCKNCGTSRLKHLNRCGVCKRNKLRWKPNGKINKKILCKSVVIAMRQKVPLNSDTGTTLYQFISILSKPIKVPTAMINEIIQEYKTVKSLIAKIEKDDRITVPKRHEMIHEMIQSAQ